MIRLFLVLLVLLVSLPAKAQSPACNAPEPVCAQTKNVFTIASFDPQASAVLIENGLLVTNRHVVADSKRVQVFLPSGGEMAADVVPTSYPGDLILLRAAGLKSARELPVGAASPIKPLYTIGTDTGQNRGRMQGMVRVFKPGRVVLMPAEGKPLARLHHNAFSQPGNSGGALVDEKGRLVAIVAAGGEGWFEAIPAVEIARLKTMSGPAHREVSNTIGKKVRLCTEALETARTPRRRTGNDTLNVIRQTCPATQNRQLWELAGQVLGRRGFFEEAVGLFARALDQDPNAVNSMVSMAVTLHLAGRYKAEIPHLRRLLEIMPRNVQVLRLSIQAGIWGQDRELAGTALKLLQRHHPNMANAAGNFIESNPPPPRKRQAGDRSR